VERRNFIVLLGGMAAAGPLTAHAEQSDRVRRIGVLMGFAEDDEVWRAYLEAFRRRLQDFGWTVGGNLQIDYRFAADSAERTRLAAEELVGLSPSLIFASTNPVVSALLRGDPYDPDHLYMGIRFDRQRLCREPLPFGWKCYRVP
jgi:putative ABC transport system substrate-binding protein